jgi:Domain of unknown function (DUF4275)
MEWYLKESNFETVEVELAKELAYAWHNEFCNEKIKWASKKPKAGYRWEIIGTDYSDKKAYEIYKEHMALAYYVMPESFGETSHTLYKTKSKPFVSLEPPRIDCYIFPKNLAWTFALTHEIGWLGPYFKMHRNYSVLQNKNLKALEAEENAKKYT